MVFTAQGFYCKSTIGPPYKCRDLIKREQRDPIRAPWADAIEWDLNLLGPKILTPITDKSGVSAASRKFAQGSRLLGNYEDVLAFLRDNPDPVPEEPRGRKTSSAWTARKARRGADAPRRRPGHGGQYDWERDTRIGLCGRTECGCVTVGAELTRLPAGRTPLAAEVLVPW